MLALPIVLVRSSRPPATILSTPRHLQHARPSHTRRSVLQHRTHHSGDRPVNLLRCVCQPYPWQGLRVFNAAEAFGLVDLEGAIVSSDEPGFGHHLRQLREAAGYSQGALAERAGLSPNGISALERGERKRPYPDTLRRLAEALGLTEAQRAELAATLRSRPEDPVPVVVQPTPGVAADLPGEPTPLIGRERESEVVRYLLTHSGSRLLILIGPGGVGKTRLALHVARTVGSQYPDGVVWVPLASLGDPALVLPALAPQLGIKAATAGDPRDAIVSHLRDRRMLLVLDNFEHVLDAATDVADLLLACPTLSVLATSRAPLNVRGEQEYVVPPLELPPAERAELDEIASVPSVRLFVWQARQKHPAFELTEGNVGIVAEICRRLEGVPLRSEE